MIILKKEITKRILLFTCIFVFILQFILPLFYITARAADLQDNVHYLDDTTISEDFDTLGIDTSYYPKNLNGKIQYIYFTESCYTDRGSGKDDYYSLYIWLYNPTDTELNTSGENVVNISFDGSEYSNQPLKFISCTDNHRFYKFRFKNADDILDEVREHAEANDGTRLYKIAGVQVQAGNLLPTDSGLGITFTFGGYAKGCHASSEYTSTLTCSKDGLETISLTVNHTSYRKDQRTDYWLFYYDKDGSGYLDSARDILGIMTDYEPLATEYVNKGYQRFDSIEDAIAAGAIYHEYFFGNNSKAYHSVYFSLPKTYVEEYSGLKEITSEWYEYKTAPIFVTSSKDAYKYLIEKIGSDIGEHNSDMSWRVLWEYGERYNTLFSGDNRVGGVYKYAYNGKKGGSDYCRMTGILFQIHGHIFLL